MKRHTIIRVITSFAFLAVFCFSLPLTSAAGRPDIQWIGGGHNDWVSGVAYSPDGQIVASLGRDQSIKLWRTSDGQCIRTLSLSSYADAGVITFSPDGLTLASAGGRIRLWRVADGQCILTIVPYAVATAVAFSPDGHTLATGGSSGAISVWNVSTGEECIFISTGGQRLNTVAFSPDGQILAAGGWSKVVKLWRLSDRQCLLTLASQPSYITTAAFSPDGQTLASGSSTSGSDPGSTGDLRLWRVSCRRSRKAA